MSKAKAIGYVRVSTAEQVNGFGLELQERAIRDHCKTTGVRLLRIERDEGLSGSNGLDTREGLARALVALERGEASRLVVYKLDRLARDLVLQETSIQRLAASRCTVHSVTEPEVDSDDHTRVLVRQVLGAIGQYERAVIRARMMAGKAAKASAGGYAGGRPRYGTRAEGKALVANDEERQVVELVRTLHGRGDSFRSICAALELAGLRPRRAERWQPAVVRRIALRAG
jgi:DNA invertase Pin-like site-specific DNA recombinase